MDPVDRIRDTIAEYTDLNPAIITSTTTLAELELDSLELVAFTMDLEDKFELDLMDASIDFETVGEFADLIAKKLENPNA